MVRCCASRDAHLHVRIAETLENQFAEIAENQPELLAHHCTEAGMIDKAAGLWGKAGQRSLERSALVEAAAQFTRALDQIAALPATPALRREQIKLQVALITPLMHIKGYGASETKAAVEHARLLIEEAETLGEAVEDPLLLFSVLFGFCVMNFIAFNGDVARDLTAQFLALAEKQRATIPLMVGHRLVGASSQYTGDIVGGRAHYDQALALYDPAKHRSVAARFGQDIRATVLSIRSTALWPLGYPEAALADVNQALQYAREIGHAPSLMYALAQTCGVPFSSSESMRQRTPKLIGLYQWLKKTGASFWKVAGRLHQGCALALTGKASDAVRSTHLRHRCIPINGSNSSVYRVPYQYLAKAHADLRQFDDAWRCIDEAILTVEENQGKVVGG